MKPVVMAACGTLILALGISACGGNGSSYQSPTTPTPPTNPAPPASGTQIGIAGNRGAQSFSPNPATASMGTTMFWKNNDGVTHRIVANDGSFDTGDIAGGGTSGSVTLRTDGTNYHCSIHPTMVGSVNAAVGTPPPCTGQYCN